MHEICEEYAKICTKYAQKNMQKYAKIFTNMHKICQNMQKYAAQFLSQKYAQICKNMQIISMPYAKTCKLCNHDFAKYAKICTPHFADGCRRFIP